MGDLADAFHLGVTITEDEQNPEKKLRNWRKGENLPDKAFIVTNIRDQIFGDDPRLSKWGDDLEAAFLKEQKEKSQPAEVHRPGVSNLSRNASSQQQYAAAASENVALVIDRLTEFFAGRSADIDAIDQFVADRMAGGSQGLLVITAPAGYGKSALAAHWCQRAESLPDQQVVKHFCSVSTGESTTSPQNVYANLYYQIADAYDEPAEHSRHFDRIVSLLQRSPNSGHQLIVWLDGVDEASGAIECFLPRHLGDRICVIVTARADDGAVPGYLAPWLSDAMATAHRPVRLSLSKLPFSDVDGWIIETFETNGLTIPPSLAWEIFKASDEGLALFVRCMIDDAVKAARAGKHTAAGNSVADYVKYELEKLRTIEKWPDYQPVFAFLTIAREAVRVDELSVLIGKRLFPDSFPRQLMRWLSVVADPQPNEPRLLSFAHPLFAKAFGEAIGYEREQALNDLCDAMIAQSFERQPSYAWRHLPQHFLNAGRCEQVSKLLADMSFVSARFVALGVETGITAMAGDWRAWWSAEARRHSAENYLLSRHCRFWVLYAERLTRLVRQGFPDIWKQLMHDVELADSIECTGLTRPSSRSSFGIRETDVSIQDDIRGLLRLEDGAGFLTWNGNGTLRLWDPAGEEGQVLRGQVERVSRALALRGGARFLALGEQGTIQLWSSAGEAGPVLRGHKGHIHPVLELEGGAGFLSGSYDKTLRLWGPSGEEGPVLRGHSARIAGALALKSGKGFLSWSDDGTLRLWGPRGEEGNLLRGHDAEIRGALALEGGAGFLSWSFDKTLRLWGPSGEEGRVLRGHEGGVSHALALEGGAGFLSWGVDNALRFWGPSGEEGRVLRGHDSMVQGALALEDGAGFISWSLDGTLRLWGAEGEEGPVLRGHKSGSVRGALVLTGKQGFLSWADWGDDHALRVWSYEGQPLHVWLAPHGSIAHVEPYGQPDHFLVAFGNRIGIVRI